MKRISFFLLFVSIPSIADELIYSNYFRDFTEAFTPPDYFSE